MKEGAGQWKRHIDRASRLSVVRQSLGEEVHQQFIDNKRNRRRHGTKRTNGILNEKGVMSPPPPAQIDLEEQVVTGIILASGTISITNTSDHYHIICTGTANVYLPASPVTGRKSIIIMGPSGDILINGNRKSFYRAGMEASPALIPVVGIGNEPQYEGTYWQFYQQWS